MKWLCYLLSLYILVLSITPCQAAHCQDEATEQHDHEKDHDDANNHEVCSPFCQCSVCVGFVLHPIFTADLQPTITFFDASQKSFFQIVSLPEVYLTFFQPPKI